MVLRLAMVLELTLTLVSGQDHAIRTFNESTAYCSELAFAIVFWTIDMPSMYRSTQLPRHDCSRDDNDVPGF
jgi:hypothetical protein